jgi:hypothetical protein
VGKGNIFNNVGTILRRRTTKIKTIAKQQEIKWQI